MRDQALSVTAKLDVKNRHRADWFRSAAAPNSAAENHATHPAALRLRLATGKSECAHRWKQQNRGARAPHAAPGVCFKGSPAAEAKA